MRGKRVLSFTLLAALAVVVLILAIGFGSVAVHPARVLRIFYDLAAGNPDVAGDTAYTIIWQIRFPRVLLGFLIGASLAAAGAAFQGLLQNPLADPYTIGVSSGAALGATAAILLLPAGFFSSQ
ncbi:MAG TPA: iron chelate uptake ABC transporter family permease subunit, partial [Bacillota bacterium]|nr:iron chelate uptake ABC transporter family permease subunit [Bacillota bacterium]